MLAVKSVLTEMVPNLQTQVIPVGLPPLISLISGWQHFAYHVLWGMLVSSWDVVNS